MNSIAIKGEKRTDLGQKAAKQLRREEQVPCVLYGSGENTHFSVPAKALKPLVYTPDFNTVEIEVDGQSHNAILKDLQFHPVTDKLLHVDFQNLIPGKKIVVELPLNFVGTSKGVLAGGKLMAQVRKLSVKVEPKDLVSSLDVDITNLELGKSIKVGELNYEGLEIMNPPGIPVAAVEIPRALKSKTSAEEKEEGAAATEE